MRYVFAFFLPPLSIAMCGRWGHFTFNLIVWLLCTFHALAVCRVSSIDKRVNRMVAAIQQAPTSGR